MLVTVDYSVAGMFLPEPMVMTNYLGGTLSMHEPCKGSTVSTLIKAPLYKGALVEERTIFLAQSKAPPGPGKYF